MSSKVECPRCKRSIELIGSSSKYTRVHTCKDLQKVCIDIETGEPSKQSSVSKPVTVERPEVTAPMVVETHFKIRIAESYAEFGDYLCSFGQTEKATVLYRAALNLLLNRQGEETEWVARHFRAMMTDSTSYPMKS